MGFFISKRIVLIILLLFLSGCGSRYKNTPLKTVSRSAADFVEEKDGVELRIRCLDLEKISKMFDSKFSASDAALMYPLLVTVKNKTEDELVLKNKHIDLDLFTAQQIKQKLSYNSGWPIAVGIAAIPVFIVGAFFASAAIMLYSVPVGGAFGLMLLPFLALEFAIGIPIIVGVTTRKANDVRYYNQALSRDLKHKVLEGQEIKAYGKKTILLFASHLPKSFKIAVTNLSREEKIEFDVSLKRKKS